MTYLDQHGRPRVVPCSGYATTGFVLAAVGLWPLALAFCGLAWGETSTGERGGHGLTVAGIVLSVLGIIGTIFAIILAASGVSLIGALMDAITP
ncbi:hypothetical protein [Actinotalea solisilvae]|uniref:hypothetical protein n=1 Tax=Actinotalea solisilvae TaxID=2072922 RepID=UPI0018F1B31D|nr:hypothetical protein [Actinotalea solisilvae]